MEAKIAAHLKQQGIKLIGFDFDQTLVSVHTRGHWRESTAKLVAKIRPFMKSLLCAVVKAGLPTAVVTFSPQARLIKEVLRAAIGDELTRNIVIIDSKQAGDKQRDGKIPHLKAAKEKLAGAASATMRQTVLIDDDKTNIAKCIKCGAHAVHVDEHASERDLESAITHAMMSISNGVTVPAPIATAELSTGLAAADQAVTPTTTIASFEEWKEMKEKDHLRPATPSAVAANTPPPAVPRSRAHPKDKYDEMDQIEQMLNAFQQNSMSPVSSPRQLLSSPPQQPNTVHVTRRTSAPGNLPEWQSTLNAQQQRRSSSTSPLRVKIGRELLGSPLAQDNSIALRRAQSSDTVISRKPTQPDARGALRKIEHNERPKQLDILSPKKSEIPTLAGSFQNHPMASLRSPNNFREKHTAAVNMPQPKMMSPRAMITSPTGRPGMQLTGPPMGRNQAIASPRATRGRPGPPPGRGKGGGKGMRV